jgi:aerobic carbon-monoxide dehydrogenase large subunit
VGGALYERMAYDENGQLLNASFMDFLMPYASEIPHIEIDHLETPSPLNPLGIKGAGEAGVIPSAAVFAAAIEDAEGFPITRMPISPSELFELRRRHTAGEIPSLHRRSAGTTGSRKTAAKTISRKKTATKKAAAKKSGAKKTATKKTTAKRPGEQT